MEDKIIIDAAMGLIEKHPDRLQPDIEQIQMWFSQVREDDPESVRRTANRILDRLSKNPEAWDLLRGEIDSGDGAKGLARGGYIDLAGDTSAVSPGTRMACPKPSCPQERTLRQKGQRLLCPEHGIPMVPKNTLP